LVQEISGIIFYALSGVYAWSYLV